VLFHRLNALVLLRYYVANWGLFSHRSARNPP